MAHKKNNSKEILALILMLMLIPALITAAALSFPRATHTPLSTHLTYTDFNNSTNSDPDGMQVINYTAPYPTRIEIDETTLIENASVSTHDFVFVLVTNNMTIADFSDGAPYPSPIFYFIHTNSSTGHQEIDLATDGLTNNLAPFIVTPANHNFDYSNYTIATRYNDTAETWQWDIWNSTSKLHTTEDTAGFDLQNANITSIIIQVNDPEPYCYESGYLHVTAYYDDLTPTPSPTPSPSPSPAPSPEADYLVTANFASSIGTNNLTVGTQLDYARIKEFPTSTTFKTLAGNAHLGIFRIFEREIPNGAGTVTPCTQWYSIAHTGSFDWSYCDALVTALESINAEPLICLGFMWSTGMTNYLPTGMTLNTTTKMPNPSDYAAYASTFVSHYGNRVTHYQIVNEPYQFTGWSPNMTRLADYLRLYNATRTAMKAINANLIISFDSDCQQTTLDYLISNNIPIDAIDFHKYDNGVIDPNSPYYETDSKLFADAESYYYTNNAPYSLSVKSAQTYYYSHTGRRIPIYLTETNMNSAWQTGTDPRQLSNMGATWTALNIRACILSNVSYFVYYQFANGRAYEMSKPAHGYGFGMIDDDSDTPYYPYWTIDIIQTHLSVGDTLYSSSSNSSSIRTLAWTHAGHNYVLVIHNSTALTDTLLFSGISGTLHYQKTDYTISFLNSQIQTGTVSSTTPITLKGYTIALFWT